MKTAYTTYEDQNIMVEYFDDHSVDISIDGVWAGSGKWDGGMVVDCAAVLSEGTYEAVDAIIIELLTEE